MIGDTILYFGCRKKAEDFIYEEELNEYVQKGVLTVSYLMTDLNQILTKCHGIGSSCILFLLFRFNIFRYLTYEKGNTIFNAWGINTGNSWPRIIEQGIAANICSIINATK